MLNHHHSKAMMSMDGPTVNSMDKQMSGSMLSMVHYRRFLQVSDVCQKMRDQENEKFRTEHSEHSAKQNMPNNKASIQNITLS
jgi:hypothetical protein